MFTLLILACLPATETTITGQSVELGTVEAECVTYEDGTTEAAFELPQDARLLSVWSEREGGETQMIAYRDGDLYGVACGDTVDFVRAEYVRAVDIAE